MSIFVVMVCLIYVKASNFPDVLLSLVGRSLCMSKDVITDICDLPHSDERLEDKLILSLSENMPETCNRIKIDEWPEIARSLTSKSKHPIYDVSI